MDVLHLTLKATTLGELVEEVYQLPSSGLAGFVYNVRLSAVVNATILRNPNKGWTDSTSAVGTDELVRLPSSVAPFRLPIPADDNYWPVRRSALEGVGISTVEQAAALTRLPIPFNSTANLEYLEVCKLTSLTGLDVQTALGLWNQGLRTLRSIADLPVDLLEEAVLEAAPAALHATLTEENRWYHYSARAREMVGGAAPASPLTLPQGPSESRILGAFAKWNHRLRHATLTEEEEASVQVVLEMLRVMRAYGGIASAMNSGSWERALDRVGAFHSVLADWADTVLPPTVGDLLDRVNQGLDDVLFEHCRELQADLGGSGDLMLREFTLSDLDSTSQTAVLSSRSDAKVSSLGKHAIRKATKKAAGASDLVTVGASQPTGSRSASAPLADWVGDDHVHAAQAVGTTKLSSLSANLLSGLPVAPLLNVQVDADGLNLKLKEAAAAQISNMDALLSKPLFLEHRYAEYVVGGKHTSTLSIGPGFNDDYLHQVLNQAVTLEAAPPFDANNLRKLDGILLSLPLLAGLYVPLAEAAAAALVGDTTRGVPRWVALASFDLLTPDVLVNPYDSTSITLNVDDEVTSLNDLASPGRTLTPGGQRPTMDDALYTHALGTAALPLGDEDSTLFANLHGAQDLEEFTSISWLPMAGQFPDNVATGLSLLGLSPCDGAGEPLVGLQVRNRSMKLVAGRDANGNAIEHSIDGHVPSTSSTNSWMVTGVSRKLTGGNTAKWRLLVVHFSDRNQDGDARVALDATVELDAFGDYKFDNWTGVSLGSGSKAGAPKAIGGGAFWGHALSENQFVQGVLAAAKVYGEQEALNVGEVLGNLQFDLDVPLEELTSVDPSDDAPTLLLTVLKELRASNATADTHYIQGRPLLAKAAYSETLRRALRIPALDELLDELVTYNLSHDELAQEDSPIGLAERIALRTGSELYQAVAEQGQSSDPLRSTAASVFTGGTSTTAGAASSERPAASTAPEYVHGGEEAVWETYRDHRSHRLLTRFVDTAVHASRGEREVLHAWGKLRSIEAGLNYMGFDPNHMPSWPYQQLWSRARELASQAEGFQSRVLTLAQETQREVEALNIAVGTVATASQNYKAAHEEWTVARQQEKEANRQLEEAQRRDEKGRAVWTAVGKAALIVAGAVATAALTVATAGVGTVAVLAAIGTAAATSGSAVVGVASTAKRVKDDVQEAEQAVITAEAYTLQADASRAEAALAVNHARAIVDFLTSEESNYLNSEAYGRLRLVVEDVARVVLERANKLAWLAERALLRETMAYGANISLRYWDRYDAKTAFLSASQLNASLEALESFRVLAASKPWQPLKTTFSMLAVDASVIYQIQDTGSALIRIDQSFIDRRFPGMFLHQLQRVEVSFAGVGDSSGVRGVLRTAVNARTRVPNQAPYVYDGATKVEIDRYYDDGSYAVEGTATKSRAPYVTLPVPSPASTLVLSDYRAAEDGFVLSSPDGALGAMAHESTDILWELVLNREGSAVDLTDIKDVQITLYFTASFDPLLLRQQEAFWAANGQVKAAVRLASQVDFEGLQELRRTHEHGEAQNMAFLQFPVDADSIEARTQDPSLDNMSMYFRGEAGKLLKIRVSHALLPFGVLVTTGANGELVSGDGDADVLDPDTNEVLVASRAGAFGALDQYVHDLKNEGVSDSALGTWAVKICGEHNPQLQGVDDDGDALVRPVWGWSLWGTMTSSETWENLHAEVLVSSFTPAATTFVFSAGHQDAKLTASFGGAGGEQLISIQVGEQVAQVRVPADDDEKEFLLGIRRIGRRASFFLDRQLVGQVDLSSRSPGSVSLTVDDNTNMGFARMLTVQPLDEKGQPLGQRLELDGDDMGEPMTESAQAPVLDLREVSDVLAVVSYLSTLSSNSPS